MTRKDLEKDFHIIGENKDIMLFFKDVPNGWGIGYCGNITLDRGKAIFERKEYTDIEELKTAIKNWGDSLEWPVYTYCPMNRDSYRLESRITWFLKEKMGFTFTRDSWVRDAYERKIGPNCRLCFLIESNMENEEVGISFTYGEYTFMQKVKDAKTGTEIISTLVREAILSMAGDMADALSVIPETEIPEIEAIKKDNKTLLGFKHADFKTTMINLLEAELAKLKS